MSTDGPAKNAARDLGVGWKVSPFVRIAAGQTFTLAEIDGPGAIQQIWMTPTGTWRYSILRFYWDDEATPSIEVPAGDFFCMGWGKYAHVNSLPVCVNPGSAFNCYWEMPFRRRCRITWENLADDEMVLYYQINYTLTDVPDDAAYLHAQFRRVNPLPYKDVFTIVDGVQGKGHFVGDVSRVGRQQHRLVGRGRDQVFPRRRRRIPDDLRHGHRGLFLRLLQLRPRRPVRPLQHRLCRPAAGDPARRDLPVTDALRDVPLAHHGPRCASSRTCG
jgi:hypothetical protein